MGGHKGLIAIKDFYPVLIRGILSTCGTFQNCFFSFGSGQKLRFSNLIWRTIFVSQCTLLVFWPIYIIETKQAKKFFHINYTKKISIPRLADFKTKACKAKHSLEEPEGLEPPKHAVNNLIYVIQ